MLNSPACGLYLVVVPDVVDGEGGVVELFGEFDAVGVFEVEGEADEFERVEPTVVDEEFGAVEFLGEPGTRFVGR